MRNKYEQMSLFDTYKSVCASMEEDKPKLFRLLDKHIDWDCLIPAKSTYSVLHGVLPEHRQAKEVSSGGISEKFGAAKDIRICE